MIEKTLDLSKFLLSVSSMNALADPLLSDHNYRVAYISFLLAREITYNNEFLAKTIIAGLLHDIGLFLFSSKEDIGIVKSPEFEKKEKRIHLHAELGFRLLKEFPFFSKVALTVRYHHRSYEEFLKNRKTTPYSSQILHLADRIDVFMSNKVSFDSPFKEVLKAKELLKEYLFNISPKAVDRRLVELFINKFVDKEAFWYELYSRNCLLESLQRFLSDFSQKLPFDAFFELARIFAYLIDFKSPFTATHSSGVAQTATALASLFKFSSQELKLMKVAGLLHDVGKIAIPKEVLEKPGKLDFKEMSVMKSHVYFSYKILSKLEVGREIVEWASYHHETLDGKGYPFKLKASELSLGSRIMAVADIFTALKEDRPYKKGLSNEEALKIVKKLSEENKLDKRIVNALVENIDKVEVARKVSQGKAFSLYRSLRKTVERFKAS